MRREGNKNKLSKIDCQNLVSKAFLSGVYALQARRVLRNALRSNLRAGAKLRTSVGDYPVESDPARQETLGLLDFRGSLSMAGGGIRCAVQTRP